MVQERKRVLITGIGVVSPFGRGRDVLLKALLEGGEAEPDESRGYRALRVQNYEPPANLDPEALAALGSASLFAADAAIQAVEDARLPFTAQTAPLIGVSFGSQLAAASEDSPAESVARILGVAGPLLTFSGAVTGALAIGEAAEIVRRGDAPVMVAGGVDRLPGAPKPAWPAIASSAARPFDVTRDGVLPSEGAAAFVLEAEELATERGANVYGELLGHGNAFSRATVMQPAPNFVDAARAMRAALLRAEVFQGEIETVFGSAAGDREGDAIEFRALKDLWGPNVDRLTVTSLQGALGQSFAAAAPVALAAALLSLGQATVPPTLGLSEPDPDFRQLDIVTAQPRKYRWETGMVNAFSAGANVSLIIRTVS